MNNEIIQPRNLRPFNIATYVPLSITTLIGLIVLPDIPDKLLALLLCVLFGLMYSYRFQAINNYASLLIYFSLQTILIVALTILAHPSDAFAFLLFVLSIQITMLLPIRAAIPALLVFYLIDSKDAFLSFDTNGLIELIFNGATIFFTGVLGYSLRQAEIADRGKQQALEELRETQDRLQEMAVSEERTRLARELHDSLGHRLTVAVVQLEGAQRLIPARPEQASDIIGTMREELRDALADLRVTVTAMRSPIAENQTLESALRAISQSFQQNTGLVIHFAAAANFPELPDSYRLAFYRAAQEGLTNIQRHAHAQNAWLNLDADDRQVTLTIQDDGRGSVQPVEKRPGVGLIGLDERASQLGGEMHFLPASEASGAKLTFNLPVPEKRKPK